MNKRILNKVLIFILGGIIFSSITVYAATTILSKDVKFTPENTDWKVENVEEAINYLYENGGNAEHEYNGLTISINENTHKPVYTYEGKTIEPLYWYGMIPDAGYLGTPYFNSWYESNTSTSFKYNATNFDVVRKITTNTSYCFGGMTTKYSFNLTNYKKYHVLINSSTVGGSLQYVTKTGNLGNDYTTNEKNYIANFSASTSKQHIVADISSNTGTYYLGLVTKCQAGTINIAAIWLEK